MRATLMPRYLTRIIALLLIPCLISDPVATIPFTSPQSLHQSQSESKYLIQSQALTLTLGGALFSTAILSPQAFAHVVQELRPYWEMAVAGLTLSIPLMLRQDRVQSILLPARLPKRDSDEDILAAMRRAKELMRNGKDDRALRHLEYFGMIYRGNAGTGIRGVALRHATTGKVLLLLGPAYSGRAASAAQWINENTDRWGKSEWTLMAHWYGTMLFYNGQTDHIYFMQDPRYDNQLLKVTPVKRSGKKLVRKSPRETSIRPLGEPVKVDAIVSYTPFQNKDFEATRPGSPERKAAVNAFFEGNYSLHRLHHVYLELLHQNALPIFSVPALSQFLLIPKDEFVKRTRQLEKALVGELSDSRAPHVQSAAFVLGLSWTAWAMAMDAPAGVSSLAMLVALGVTAWMFRQNWAGMRNLLIGGSLLALLTWAGNTSYQPFNRLPAPELPQVSSPGPKAHTLGQAKQVASMLDGLASAWLRDSTDLKHPNHKDPQAAYLLDRLEVRQQHYLDSGNLATLDLYVWDQRKPMRLFAYNEGGVEGLEPSVYDGLDIPTHIFSPAITIEGPNSIILDVLGGRYRITRSLKSVKIVDIDTTAPTYFVETLRMSPEIAVATTESTMTPLSQDRYARLQKSKLSSPFSYVSYSAYLREHLANEAFYRDLKRYLEKWQSDPAFRPLIELLQRHKAQIIFTHRLLPQLMATANYDPNIAFLNPRKIYGHADQEVEFFLIYYLLHELGHMSQPQASETEVHEGSVRGAEPWQHLHQQEYNKLRYLVDRSKMGDDNSKSMLELSGLPADFTALHNAESALAKALNLNQNQIAYVRLLPPSAQGLSGVLEFDQDRIHQQQRLEFQAGGKTYWAWPLTGYVLIAEVHADGSFTQINVKLNNLRQTSGGQSLDSTSPTPSRRLLQAA